MLSNSWRASQNSSSSANPLAVSSTTGATAPAVMMAPRSSPTTPLTTLPIRLFESDATNVATSAPQRKAAPSSSHGSCSYRSSWSTRKTNVGTGNTAAAAAIPSTAGFGSSSTSSSPIPKRKNSPLHPRQPHVKKRRRCAAASSGSGGGGGIERLM